jgi:hypothetical protein
MSTKRKRVTANKTRKCSAKSPSLKLLYKGYPLFAAKEYEGSTILEYNKNQELQYGDKCLMQNSSWFGDLEVARSYKTKTNHIYKWKTKKQTTLLNINKANEFFIECIFRNTQLKLKPAINLTREQQRKVSFEHPYLEMSSNEKALYEFKFCFGYITVHQQYEFMVFVKYLIKNKLVDIKTRGGESILSKLEMKTAYYNIASPLGKKEKFNRLSFYLFDKHAIMNLCKINHSKRLTMAGVYQKNDTSFWFPDFIVYKMNIKEYILFNPQDNVEYVSMVE